MELPRSRHPELRVRPDFPHRGPLAAAAAEPVPYDPIADWQRFGARYCPGCFLRFHHLPHPDAIPAHECRGMYLPHTRAGVWG